MPETQTASEMTIDAYVKLFFTNFQLMTGDQLKNMVFACKNFCSCFDKTESDIQDLVLISKDPIQYIYEKDINYFETQQWKRLLRVKQKLGRFELVYYRDQKRGHKLKKMYFLDEDKPKIRRYYSLGEVVDIRDFVKDEITRIFTKVALENSVPIDPFNLPTLGIAPINPVGVE